jgi:pyridoxal phosphate enzyme (YggS family)
VNASPNPLVLNARDVRRRIGAACERVGRDPADVRMVAVTKYFGADMVRRVAEAGLLDVGENRVDALVEKRAAIGGGLECGPPTWHFIGHLQRNKVRRALPAIDMLHSGDGMRLLKTLDAEVARQERPPLPVLVQVNASGEGTKGGFRPEELAAALPAIAALPHLSLRGLMTMAPAVADPEDVRQVFRDVREMRDEARTRGYLEGHELSMGMSGDFEVAVEEGATIIRVGRILYAGVETP